MVRISTIWKEFFRFLSNMSDDIWFSWPFNMFQHLLGFFLMHSRLKPKLHVGYLYHCRAFPAQFPVLTRSRRGNVSFFEKQPLELCRACPGRPGLCWYGRIGFDGEPCKSDSWRTTENNPGHRTWWMCCQMITSIIHRRHIGIVFQGCWYKAMGFTIYLIPPRRPKVCWRADSPPCLRKQ